MTTESRVRSRSFDYARVARYATLIVLLILFIDYHLRIFQSYVIPTYGNTMYHVGIERLTLESGYYPAQELSYNGGFPNFYVPAYRLLIASQSLVSGIDVMLMSGLVTILLSVAVFGIVYSISRRFAGVSAAIAALFFLTLSPEIAIFTLRALPELLGLFTLPLTLFFIVVNKTQAPFRFNRYVILSVVAAALTALTHQMTLLTLAAVLSIYVLTQVRNRNELLKALVPLVALLSMYGLWQLYSLHTISILGLSQVKYHEGTPVDFFASANSVGFFERAGLLVLPFAVVGLAWLQRTKTDKRFLLYSWVVASLLLTKNDLFGVGIFMDRFLTFFVQSLIIAGGIGAFATLTYADTLVARLFSKNVDSG
ncbi:MAG: hypothetical protein LUP95_01015 [Euryarchaeota archaeon]|nr:hypothetical protein [Euryarchaeota archaeon]